jgi:import inner membrane translocase subunit TIM54
LVGRHTLKEYLEGLKRGWTGGVDEWEWEKEIEARLKYDGVFESPPEPVESLFAPDVDGHSTSPASPGSAAPTSLPGSLALLSRSTPAPLRSAAVSSSPDQATSIPAHLHTPPNPLPPSPPILLVPFVSRLGFKQVPWMVYDFFTERYRVQSGADAAVALIEQQTRPLEGHHPDQASGPSDLDFDAEKEAWYKKAWAKLPEKIAEARKDYYKELQTRIDDTRALARGDRQLTEAEKVSTKPLVSEADLVSERKKKELRWMGQEEGWGIVNAPVTWDERFEGWLRIYQSAQDREKEMTG